MFSANDQIANLSSEAVVPGFEKQAYDPESATNAFFRTTDAVEAPYLGVDSDSLASASADALQAASINKQEVNRALNPSEIRNFTEGAGQRIILLRNDAVLKQNSIDISSWRNKEVA
ncbi:MAG: hypothetical protein ABIQ64_03480 [Candidatus Saccharimonadales bacterium]